MNTKSALSTALTTTLLAASALLASTSAAAAEDGPANSGAPSLTGPIMVLLEANRLGEGAAQGAAQNAAQHVNASVCDVTALIGVLDSPAAPSGPKQTDCAAQSTSGANVNEIL